MYHPILIPILLLVLIVFLAGGRTRQQAPVQVRPQARQPEPKEVQLTEIAPLNEQKLSSDEVEQLRQALALNAEIKKLEGAFAEARLRFSTTPTGQDQAQVAARQGQWTIIAEQVRIARSHRDQLMRFVMAPYQGSLSTQHTPSFDDASWAFTAANLTLGFAHKRVAALD